MRKVSADGILCCLTTLNQILVIMGTLSLILISFQKTKSTLELNVTITQVISTFKAWSFMTIMTNLSLKLVSSSKTKKYKSFWRKMSDFEFYNFEKKRLTYMYIKLFILLTYVCIGAWYFYSLIQHICY